MKTQLLLFIAVIVLLTGGRAYGVPDKIFTSSGQILPGEEWNTVRTYNDDTIVDMLGGFVEGMGAYDASTVNVTAGHVNTLTAWESSTVNVSGGEVYGLWAEASGTVNLSHTGSVFNLAAGDFGVANVTGGTIEYLGAIESGTANLYGGLVTDSLWVGESATGNIFGYDLVKTNSGGRYGYGQIYGYWFDDSAFTIDLNGSQTYSRINLIPEPSSLILLGLGSLLLRKRKNGRC